MFANSDFSDLLRLFNAGRVRYLVIGGFAVIQYAEPRFTADLDLWVGTDPRNAGAVYKALREFGAPQGRFLFCCGWRLRGAWHGTGVRREHG